MTPTTQEKLDLITWVEDFPARENLSQHQDVIKACAERYGNTQRELRVIVDRHIDMFHATMRQLCREHRSHLQPGEIPSADFLEDAFHSALSASLLKMWTYASEYYQRWQLPDMASAFAIGEEELVSFFDDLGDAGPES